MSQLGLVWSVLFGSVLRAASILRIASPMLVSAPRNSTRPLFCSYCGEPVLQRGLRRALDARADRRLHLVGFGRQAVDAGDGARLAADLVDQMEPGGAAHPVVRHEVELGRLGLDHLRLGDRAVVLHAGQHVGEALLRAVAVLVRVEIGRALGETCEERRFLEIDVLHRLAEIGAGGEVDAPGRAAEIDRVEVDLENFLLADCLLQPRRDDHLADLALEGDVVADQQVLRHLLGDGGTALALVAAHGVHEGARHAAHVDAVVLVEALVLRGEEGFLHRLGDLRQRHPLAAVVGLEQLGELGARAVEHRRHLRQPQSPEAGVVGQVGGGAVVELDHFADVDDFLGDLLVLAELLVGEVQVVEVDALEARDLAGRGLLVGHDHFDQAVEIDILDVECLAHVVAAVPKDLEDLRFVTDGIEFGFDRVRPGHHQAEGKGRRKNLDENGFHVGAMTPGRLPAYQLYKKAI